MAAGPIAMFDSGFGGLTVARAVLDLLPNEDLVYLGDTARYPYGPRPLAEVAEFAVEIADHLVERFHAKVLVVACNTAAAAALEQLEQRYDIPVLGVIEPGARAVISASNNGKVGVLGTLGTIQSGSYQRLFAAEVPEVELCALACPGFVEFVERGEFDSEQVHVLAERLLAPALAAGVDSVLLGCTHYPYLARTIADVMGREVVLVSSAEETAFEVKHLLEESGLGSTERAQGPQFLTTGDPDRFQQLGSMLLGPELAEAQQIHFGSEPRFGH